MTNYEKVFNILIVKPDDLFSYKDIMALTNLEYKQVTRAIQTLTNRDLIFRYVNPYSGVGRGRGKIAYFGVSEEIYANKTKTG